jgi:hypothetical protein
VQRCPATICTNFAPLFVNFLPRSVHATTSANPLH